jgi:hypothetical protein
MQADDTASEAPTPRSLALNTDCRGSVRFDLPTLSTLLLLHLVCCSRMQADETAGEAPTPRSLALDTDWQCRLHE